MTTAPVIVERNQKLEVYVDLNVEDWLSASEVQAGEVGLSAIEFDVAAVTR